jgi:uncharacterized membrane protein (UPF0127 family)
MSNKMPSDSRAKTVWERKKLLIVTLASVALLVLLPVSSRLAQAIECMQFHMPTTGTLHVGNKALAIETVANNAARAKGLSGRPCIKDNQAMLFAFDIQDTADHCFWMKDMRFAIDMVWLDANKRVVHTAHNVQPSTYPTTFCPDQPTRYVLEVKANTARRLGLNAGAVVSF